MRTHTYFCVLAVSVYAVPPATAVGAHHGHHLSCSLGPLFHVICLCPCFVPSLPFGTRICWGFSRALTLFDWTSTHVTRLVLLSLLLSYSWMSFTFTSFPSFSHPFVRFSRSRSLARPRSLIAPVCAVDDDARLAVNCNYNYNASPSPSLPFPLRPLIHTSPVDRSPVPIHFAVASSFNHRVVAVVVVAVLTRLPPFARLSVSSAVRRVLIRNRRPPRPVYLISFLSVGSPPPPPIPIPIPLPIPPELAYDDPTLPVFNPAYLCCEGWW